MDPTSSSIITALEAHRRGQRNLTNKKEAALYMNRHPITVISCPNFGRTILVLLLILVFFPDRDKAGVMSFNQGRFNSSGEALEEASA